MKAKAFTLIELLLVLATLSILMLLGIIGWMNFRAKLTLHQAQQSFVQELNRARSDSRKLSVDQTVSWNRSSITVTAEAEERVTHLPQGIDLVQERGYDNLTYTAPYGRNERSTDYRFLLKNPAGQEARVIVYGVTGQVVVGE
jgi:prepilin-type N-terminal cleavage/methylation domain-containing protein